MRFYICGSRGSYPCAGTEYQQFGCSTSCYALVSGSYALVMDCGTGAVHLPQILGHCNRIDLVFTHCHLDHLIGIVSCLCNADTNIRLRLIETQTEEKTESAVAALVRPPYWPVTSVPKYTVLHVPLGEKTVLDEEENIAITTHPANHPGGGSLLRVDQGDTGLCLLCDHEQCGEDPKLVSFALGSKWIIFDGTFTQEEYPSHRGWGHSTWQEGIRTAREVGADRLLITHHAPWRTDKELLRIEQQARQQYPGCTFAREGEVYEL